ncbi:MAG: RodZ domain-containing protein [Bacillus sp. (in: firmicutes)]
MTELGNAFKAAREEKGLSLDDLQRLTKIQKRYLKGIEQGNYDMMPGKFYVRAFIKQYAEAVGLDPEEVFEQYKNDIPSVREEETTEQRTRAQSKKSISAGHSKYLEMLPKVLVGVFIAGLAILLYFLFTNYFTGGSSDEVNNDDNTVNIISPADSGNSKDEKADDEKVDDEEATKEEDAEEKQKEETKEEDKESDGEHSMKVVESSGKNTEYELEGTDSFNLKVESENTWLSVKTGNGESLYYAMLTGTSTEEFDLTEEDSVELVIGNTVDTKVYVNGELLEYEIPATEKVNQTITITYKK